MAMIEVSKSAGISDQGMLWINSGTVREYKAYFGNDEVWRLACWFGGEQLGPQYTTLATYSSEETARFGLATLIYRLEQSTIPASDYEEASNVTE